MIYGWTPGIGDPTPAGWLTVMFYGLAALLCLRASRVERRGQLFWQGMAFIMAILALNKQLDLQSLFTAVGRHVAMTEHWYGQRHKVQMLFIGGLAALAAVTVLLLAVITRTAGRGARLASVGITLLLFFIVTRAASFHHIDLFIKSRVWGVHWNVILEMTGIALVAYAALLAGTGRARSGKRRRRY